MSERVKNHKKWNKELIEWFDRKQIYYCEKCGTTSGRFDISHSRKRWDIHTRDEYFEAIRACRKCHQEIEHSGDRENLRQRHLEIIGRRSSGTKFTNNTSKGHKGA